jgi:hypothetical protein
MQVLKKWFPLIAGVLFVGPVLAGVIMTSGQPGSDATPATILAWDIAHKNHTSAAGFLTAWGVIAGLAFYGCVFQRIRTRSPVLAATGLAGAAVFALGGLIAAGTYLAMGDKPSLMTGSTAQTLNLLNNDGTYSMIIAGLAVFYLTTAVAVLRTGAIPIPRTWGIITLVFGLVALSAFLAFFAFLASPVWVLGTGILLVIQNGRTEPLPEPHLTEKVTVQP